MRAAAMRAGGALLVSLVRSDATFSCGCRSEMNTVSNAGLSSDAMETRAKAALTPLAASCRMHFTVSPTENLLWLVLSAVKASGSCSVAALLCTTAFPRFLGASMSSGPAGITDARSAGMVEAGAPVVGSSEAGALDFSGGGALFKSWSQLRLRASANVSMSAISRGGL